MIQFLNYRRIQAKNRKWVWLKSDFNGITDTFSAIQYSITYVVQPILHTLCGISYYFEESIETKFISEIGLEQNSENSIMEITGFDRYVMGGKVTAMRDLIICTYPESRILKQSAYLNQSVMVVTLFNQKLTDGVIEQIMFFKHGPSQIQKMNLKQYVF